MSDSGLSLLGMAFDQSEITQLLLGSEDYPEGSVTRKNGFWLVEVETVDDEDGITKWDHDISTIDGELLDVFKTLCDHFYIQIKTNQSWEDFKEYVKPVGRIYWDLMGSFNGVDFEDIEFPNSTEEAVLSRPLERIQYQEFKNKKKVGE